MKLIAKDLTNLPLIDSTGETIGKITDLLFDDREWKVRYLVVDAGGWLEDKRVLVTPDNVVLTPASIKAKQLHATLTRSTIGDFPPLDSEAPVSRRYEVEMASYYKTTPYWAGNPVWNETPPVTDIPPTPDEQAQHEAAAAEIEKCHVRSISEITGYEVMSSNAVSFGEVDVLEIVWLTRAIVNIGTKEGFLWTKEEHEILPDEVTSIDWHLKRLTLSTPFIESVNSPEAHLASTAS